MSFRFAKEGVPCILIASFITILSWVNHLPLDHPKLFVFIFWAGCITAVNLFLIFFFRDPERIPENHPQYEENVSIFSPADGILRDIEVEDGRLTIYVQMRLKNVHVTRSHVSGKVTKVVRCHGIHAPIYYFFKNEGQASRPMRKNARVSIDIEEDVSKKHVNYQLICGNLARRAIPYVKKGQVIKMGERMGIIMFGSLCRVTLPFDKSKYDIVVKIGDPVKGGKTLLAEKKLKN